MRHSYRPAIPPKPHAYRTQVLDHLGLVAGMFEELGITEVIDQATQQNPEMRIVTAGHAVKAMVLNGLGFVNQQLYLVPHFFQNRSYWIPGSYAPALSEKQNACLRLWKNKGFKEENVTKFGVDAIGMSTTLESNKSLQEHVRFTHGSVPKTREKTSLAW